MPDATELTLFRKNPIYKLDFPVVEGQKLFSQHFLCYFIRLLFYSIDNTYIKE
jgi:hypothetical protein